MPRTCDLGHEVIENHVFLGDLPARLDGFDSLTNAV